ncbi:hypothetical protein DRJ17_06490 [Candidatus Woesearchaeota archaeon]|nr:MAG: hypothetical protein DRJ17_06490 [Candidatus Woesearchaeota archaeon]
MSMAVLIQPNQTVSLSGSLLAILAKRLLHYHAVHQINVSLTGDFKTDRELIFGRRAFIKDAPLVKAVMMICGYIKAKAYITPQEEFADKIVSIYGDKYGKYFFIEVLSALLARVTNYFQAIQGVRDEDPEYIKQDINMIINELIYRLANPNYEVKFVVKLYEYPQQYEVLVEIFEK